MRTPPSRVGTDESRLRCRAGADSSTTAARRMEAGKPTVVEGLEGLAAVPAGAVLSVGNFDGVHLGHERILATARELKSRDGAPAVAVVTFEPHPTTVLRP